MNQIMMEVRYSLNFRVFGLSSQVLSDSLWPYGLQNQWCHPAISSSVIPLFSFCLQSFLSSRSFPMNWLFITGGQSIRDAASASVLLMNIQGGYPLRLTGLISCCPRDSQKSSSAPQFKSISSLGFCLLYGPTLILCGKTIALTILWLCWQRVYNHKSSKRVTPFWVFLKDGLRRISSSL